MVVYSSKTKTNSQTFKLLEYSVTHCNQLFIHSVQLPAPTGH